ncbi:MAG: amino acid permease, partial [Elusimicrobiales bacterium]
VGANGILNRVAEDGILPQSIRRLHPRYGTTYIIITSIAALQALIVLLSGGDIFILGEAYAFGVLWSITFNIASLILLRFKQDNLEREWYYPLNIKWRRYKLPIGLFLLFIIMFSLSLINLFTKKLATIFGLSFTLILYIVFTYFERKQTTCSTDIHKLNEEDIDEKVNINAFNDVELVFKNFNKEKRILVPVRNPNNLVHLKWVLENFSDEETDIAVLYVRFEKGYDYSAGNENMNYEEKELFKKVILLAEKYGKKIHPLIVSSNEPFYVIIYSALVGVFQMIVMGVSGTTGAEIQMENIALWWGTLRPKDFKSSIEVRIIWDGRTLTYNLT